MRIATYNVNGVNGRLPVLLRWLEETGPDIVCLQELKSPDDRFPAAALEAAGYGAVWHGQKSWNGVAILARGAQPLETRRGLPGDPDDSHSRYIEAAVNGLLVGCLYLPNGNPAPGPKFDYKLKWFERFAAHAKTLLAHKAPVVLAGDYNVMPTDLDVYKPERWLDDALFRPEVREAYRRLVAQGWTDALRELHPGERIYTFWDYFRNAFARDAGLRIDHLLLSPQVAGSLKAADVDSFVRGWEKTSDHAPTWVELGDRAWSRRAAALDSPAPGGPLGDSAAKSDATRPQARAHRPAHGRRAGRLAAAGPAVARREPGEASDRAAAGAARAPRSGAPAVRRPVPHSLRPGLLLLPRQRHARRLPRRLGPVPAGLQRRRVIS